MLGTKGVTSGPLREGPGSRAGTSSRVLQRVMDSQYPEDSFFLSLFFFVFLGPHPQHLEIPSLEVQSEPQLSACARATAMPDLSCVCSLQDSSWQRRILNLLREARDGTPNLMVPNRIRFCRTAMGTPLFSFFFFLATPMAFGSSQARDQTQATAVTTPDPQPTKLPRNSKSQLLNICQARKHGSRFQGALIQVRPVIIIPLPLSPNQWGMDMRRGRAKMAQSKFSPESRFQPLLSFY